MPTRFFNDAQRVGYGRYDGAPSDDDLARCFYFDETDRALITGLRGSHNRVGFAVQLGTVRFVGIFPSEGLDIPQHVVTSVTKSLGEEQVPVLEGYWKGRVRWRHAALIRTHYGFRSFNHAVGARFQLTRWLYALCWMGDDRPGLLMERAVHWLMVRKILLPGLSTLERLTAKIRNRCRERRWQILSESLTANQRQLIEQLITPDDNGATKLDDLRAVPKKFAPGELMRQMERIDLIRAQDISTGQAIAVPDTTIERMARQGRLMRITALMRLPEPRKSATLVALFRSLEGIAIDEALSLFEGLMDEVVRGAAKAYITSRMRSLRDLDTAALILAETVEQRVLGGVTKTISKNEIPDDELRAAILRTRALARPPDDKHFVELCASWRRVNRLFYNLLRRIEFDASHRDDNVIIALKYLTNVKIWAKDDMADAPMGCVISPWNRHVSKGSKLIDNRAYVFAVLEATRKAIKRRDVFVTPSIRFANPNLGLLDDKSWQSSKPTILRALGRSSDARAECACLSRTLDAAYLRTASKMPDNPSLRLDRDGIVLTPLDRLEEPESLVELRNKIKARLPKIELTDLVLEVATRTGFPASFVHVSERQARVEGFETSLCACLVSEACNIGFEPMVRSDYGPLKRERLSWVNQNFIRDDTIRAANAHIIAAHDALPIARIWGAGDVASADGIRFVVQGNPAHAGPNPKYFGARRGITWYNLVSDQSSELSGVSVPGTLRDSMVLLGVLLEQETHLNPREIMTDTAAYSDVVFGLFWLLGYRFCPRLADIGGTRLWRVNKAADYGELNAISKNRVDMGRIEKDWDDMLRLAGSLKLGHVQADAAMRMLSVKGRATSLSRSLAELGRLIKTLHILDYVDDSAKRRRILTQLNRHEFRHSLARRVCHGNRGELSSPYREGQEQKLGVLGLVVNMIAFWNTLYIQEIVRDLKAQGHTVNPADLARISPLTYSHINFLGRYSFLIPDAVKNGKLRPLRETTYE